MFNKFYENQKIKIFNFQSVPDFLYKFKIFNTFTSEKKEVLKSESVNEIFIQDQTSHFQKIINFFLGNLNYFREYL